MYPRVRFEGGGNGVVSRAGSVLLVETVRKSGLDGAISAAPAPAGRHRDLEKTFGHHPLVAFVDHGQAGSGEPVAALLRPGNAGSNTAADHITTTQLTLAQLPKHLRRGRQTLIRTDSTDGTERPGAWVAEITDMPDLTTWPRGMRVDWGDRKPAGSPKARSHAPFVVNQPPWGCATGSRWLRNPSTSTSKAVSPRPFAPFGGYVIRCGGHHRNGSDFRQLDCVPQVLRVSGPADTGFRARAVLACRIRLAQSPSPSARSCSVQWQAYCRTPGGRKVIHLMLRYSKHRRKLNARKKLSVLVLSFATLAVGSAAWAGQSAPSTGVVVDSLSLSASPSGQLKAAAKVHSARTIRVQALTVAVRSANGSHFDFPGATAPSLGPSQTTFTSGSRTFPAGTYTAFVAYKYRDTWRNLSPVKTFTSGGTATPAPGPTASASPSPAPTPTPTGTTPSPVTSPSASAAPVPSPSQTTSTTGAAPLGIPGTWRPAFADEFNGTTLDSSKWNPNWLGCPTCTTKPVNSAELGAYAPSQVSVSGGSLHLKAEKVQTTANDGKTYAYRSGLVESNGKAQFTYGAFEARIYTPAASPGVIANWPAFWTDGQNWPEDGEMDVMEGLGGGKACYHFHSPAGGPGGCAPGDFTGWHTYGAEWKPGSVTYYYDGKQVGQITTGITSSPMYLILNNGVSTEHGGPIVTPADMMTDYVRVWQH
ncbi:family 16 glycosylhydrolase [Streptomyces lunaelactis]|nr:family 16 glycosylhydrolase [Streptomyces lunaelactis]